jgi:hypothetical protein
MVNKPARKRKGKVKNITPEKTAVGRPSKNMVFSIFRNQGSDQLETRMKNQTIW